MLGRTTRIIEVIVESIEAKILLKNLLDRVITLDDGSKQLSGKLTDSELDALNYALSLLSGSRSKIAAPTVRTTTSKADNTNTTEPQSQFVENEASIELDTSVLKLPSPNENVRLCLDFGTAMSKATLVDDNTDEDFEDIHVLKLGKPGNQEEISETMLVSSVYIDNDGLLWFGQNAVTHSVNENHDGSRRRLDNIKRWLSEEGFADKVNEFFNPTDILITYGDMIQAYLMFFTWAVNHSLEEADYPRNILRRFAMPIFEGEKKRETIFQLKKMLGDAQILADTFYTKLQDGISLESFMEVSKKLKIMKNDYLFIADEITEPLGVAGSILSWKTKVTSLVMVIDVGAGTSDFSLFKIAYNPVTGKSGSREVAGSSGGIQEAGNHLDTLLNGYILKKSGITHEDPLYLNILGALKLTIRDHKEALFRDGFVSVSLFNNDVVEIKEDEFLSLEQVKQFGQTLKDTMVGILDNIDVSWVKAAPDSTGEPTLAVALTGGGAELPMVKGLANGYITIKGTKLKLVESMRFPKWLYDEGYEDLEEEYPRIAVSLGGARKNIIPHGDKAAMTAGDIKETPVLGGYYQKGS